jgi:hypothetical protein
MEKDPIWDGSELREVEEAGFEFVISPDSGNGNEDVWTIRVVKLPERRPITQQTVKDLLRDKDLRDVARVAMKYAK